MDEKVVIFTSSKRMVHILRQRIHGEGMKALTIIGDVKSTHRKDIINEFKINDAKVNKCIVATDCLAHGANLQEARHVINFDLHPNPAIMLQRAGRIHRIGSKFDTVYVWNLIVKLPVETRMLEILKPKVILSGKLMSDKPPDKKKLGYKGVVKLLDL